MGNQQSCENLTLTPDGVCNIAKCTQRVTCFGADSASPTDIWKVELHPNTKYGDTLITTPLILKIFVAGGDYVTIASDASKEICGNLKIPEELIYEKNIYEHVIDSMLTNKVNPFFVKYYGGSTNCTFDDLENILTKGFPNENQTDIQYNLIRNLVYMVHRWQNRPAITDQLILDASVTQPMFDCKDVLKYGMIATAAVTGDKFETWLQTQIAPPTAQNPNELSAEGWKGVLQVVSALAALESYKCSHNDLHLQNIFVENTQETIYYLTFDAYGETYTTKLKCNMKVALYDWDRASYKTIGDNPYLINNWYMCVHYGECKDYIPQRDLLKFIIGIWKFIGPATRAKLQELIFSSTATPAQKQNFIDNIINNNANFQGSANWLLKRDGLSMQKPDFQGLRTPKQFLAHLTNLLQTVLPTDVKLEKGTPPSPQSNGQYYSCVSSRVVQIKRAFKTKEEKEQESQPVPIDDTEPLVVV
jgi:hypothetical protein